MPRYIKEQRLHASRQRAKQTVVALVQASKGRLIGKLRLYKAFYKAHIEYFNATGLDLTGYPMVHMTNGPGIDNAQELVDELMEDGLLLEEIGTRNRPKERVYTLIGNPDLDLDEEKLNAIQVAVAWANSLDEQALKEESHNRSWYETSPGEAQNIFLDVLSEETVTLMRDDFRDTILALREFATPG